jgi:uncharacterized membrane protein
VRLPLRTVGVFGVALIAGHNLVDTFLPSLLPLLQQGRMPWIWQVLYFGGPIQLGPSGPPLFVLYSIVPWIGVMAAGYAFGAVMLLEPARRRRICLRIGGVAIVVFLVLRGFNLYGNPTPWGAPQSRFPPVLSFLNTNKYPASFLFLLMTLGPIIALIPALDRARGWWARLLATFGKVPFFFYLIHIPLIHAAAILVSLLRTGSVDPWLFANHPVMIPPAPAGYTWSLGLLYLVAALVVGALYLPCRWFADLNQSRKSPWLGYL